MAAGRSRRASQASQALDLTFCAMGEQRFLVKGSHWPLLERRPRGQHESWAPAKGCYCGPGTDWQRGWGCESRDLSPSPQPQGSLGKACWALLTSSAPRSLAWVWQEPPPPPAIPLLFHKHVAKTLTWEAAILSSLCPMRKDRGWTRLSSPAHLAGAGLHAQVPPPTGLGRLLERGSRATTRGGPGGKSDPLGPSEIHLTFLQQQVA